MKLAEEEGVTTDLRKKSRSDRRSVLEQKGRGWRLEQTLKAAWEVGLFPHALTQRKGGGVIQGRWKQKKRVFSTPAPHVPLPARMRGRPEGKRRVFLLPSPLTPPTDRSSLAALLDVIPGRRVASFGANLYPRPVPTRRRVPNKLPIGRDSWKISNTITSPGKKNIRRMAFSCFFSQMNRKLTQLPLALFFLSGTLSIARTPRKKAHNTHGIGKKAREEDTELPGRRKTNRELASTKKRKKLLKGLKKAASFPSA